MFPNSQGRGRVLPLSRHSSAMSCLNVGGLSIPRRLIDAYVFINIRFSTSCRLQASNRSVIKDAIINCPPALLFVSVNDVFIHRLVYHNLTRSLRFKVFPSGTAASS